MFDKTFSHACFDPHLSYEEKDFVSSWRSLPLPPHTRNMALLTKRASSQGLSKEIILENRRREYELAMSKTALAELDLIAKTIKHKLAQRNICGEPSLGRSL
jgi:hypothetical protein